MSLATTPNPTMPHPSDSDPPMQDTIQYPDCDEDAATIDSTTRSRLSSANGGQCWLCGLHGKHPTRVVTTRDIPILTDFQQRGVIHLPDLDAFENLVFLCPGCYIAFKDPDPVWAFIPIGLDDLIEAEEDFQARRQVLATRGEHLPRPRPTNTLPLSYARYQIRPGYLFTHIFTSTPTKQWPGSPLAAIVRSTRIRTGRERLPEEDGGMPMDVALKLQQLLLLYGAPVPRLVTQIAGALDRREPQFVSQDSGQFERPDNASHDGPQSHAHEESERPRRSDRPIPGLTDLGDAFNSAIRYVQDHSGQHNLIPQAHAWLATEIPSILLKLRTELRKLNENKDNPVLLPEYALDCHLPLCLYSTTIPFALKKYSGPLMDYLLRLLHACGLKATAMVCNITHPFIALSIKFSPGADGCERDTIGNRIFDPEFEREFVSGIHTLMLDSK